MHYVFYLITPAGLFVKHVVHDLELGHHHQGAGEGQGDQQGGDGHDDHMPYGHLSGLNKGGQRASYALLISEAYVGVNDESVSVHCNQHDAGAAQEHGDALDDARNLADPVL